jgi:hypothetical protein
MGLFHRKPKNVNTSAYKPEKVSETYQELKDKYQVWDRIGLTEAYRADDRLKAAKLVLDLLGMIDSEELNWWFYHEAKKEKFGSKHPVFGWVREGQDPYFMITKQVNDNVLKIEHAKSSASELEQNVDAIPLTEAKVQQTPSIVRHTLSEMPAIALTSISKSFNYEAKLSAYCVIEPVTTGPAASTDRMIEFNAIRYEEFKPVAAMTVLVYPGKNIPTPVSNKCGITDDMVEDAPNFEAVGESIQDFVGPLPIVSWNAAQTLKFLFVSGLDLITRRRAYDVQELARKAENLESDMDDYLTVSQSHDIYCRNDRGLSRCYAVGKLFELEIRTITGKENSDED